MKTLCIALFSGISLVFLSCDGFLPDWNLDKKIILEIADVQLLTVDSLRITTNIYGLENEDASLAGIVWLEGTSAPPTLSVNNGDAILGGILEGGQNVFQIDAGKFKPNTTYTLAAFALVDDTEYYGDTLHFDMPNGQVHTFDFTYQGGRILRMGGQLFGTSAGIVAKEHGFVVSQSNPSPTADDQKIDLGERRNDLPFYYDFDQAVSGVPLYFRAYARFLANGQEAYVYGETRSFDGNLFDVWEPLPPLPSGFRARVGAIAFSIGQHGFVGLGLDADNNYLNDLWMFDPVTQNWTLMAPLPGPGRENASVFVIGETAFVGFGANDTEDFNDLYRFTEASGWSQVPLSSPWPEKMQQALAFSSGGYGFLGAGYPLGDPVENFWRFNPAGETWTPRNGTPGPLLGFDSEAFVLNGRAFAGIGYNESNFWRSNFWEYDPASDTWAQKADFEGGVRANATSFSIDDHGFICSGSDWVSLNGILPEDLWRYDPQTNIWEEKPFEGPAGRVDAAAFSIGSKAYLGTGMNAQQELLKDFWVFISQP